MRYEVWAPHAGRVTLALGDERIPMDSDGAAFSVEAPIGADYGFLLDDDETVLPDPRSRWQPDGVHGRSRVYADDFAWTDAEWQGRELANGVIYELHIGTFTPEGTLDAAIARLDHLVDLGIDFVELLPVNAFNGEHNWGYDGVLWYAVQESYGGPAAYQRFVDACHARGLAVIQDVVYNHFGPSGNYLPRFGPYLRSGQATSWGDSVNLDEEWVRGYILDNATMWMRDYHVDGLRLDAVHALVDTGDKHLLQELAEETSVLAALVHRPLTLIAESDLNDPVMISPRPEAYGLTAQWSDDYHHALHVALTGETSGYYEDFASLGALAKTATRGFFHDGTWSSFRERDHGTPLPEDTPTWKLVAFAQDHDQIGNRAAGDRLSATLDDDMLLVAAVLTLAGPFTPMLFMGEEFGARTPWQFFTSHPEPELGRATAEGRIAEFAKMGWDPAAVPDPQDPETFHRSKLDWDAVEPRILAAYTELIRLRHETPELHDPSLDALSAEFDDALRTFRLDRSGLSILVNLSGEPQDFAVEVDDVLFATSPIDGSQLPPTSAAVIRRARE